MKPPISAGHVNTRIDIDIDQYGEKILITFSSISCSDKRLYMRSFLWSGQHTNSISITPKYFQLDLQSFCAFHPLAFS